MSSRGEHLLARLFRPRSAAVVGASPKGGFGLTTVRNMIQIGFPGEFGVVHPSRTEVEGVRAAPSLRELGFVPDAIAVALPAQSIPAVLEEAAEIGVGAAVVYASGFGELGEEGARIQRELADTYRGRLSIVGPNCLGVASYRGRSALWGVSMPFVHIGGDGSVAIAGQSGNLSLTTMLSGRLPSVAYCASLGNQLMLDVADCLEYYLEDPGVRVVALIIEGLSDVARFRRLAMRAAERDVALVALKLGRSSRGEAATIAHTGTLAGDDAAYDAVFRQVGVIRVADLDELVATCSLLAADQRPRSASAAIFAVSGGECGLVADLAEDQGVALPELDAQTCGVLSNVLPDYGHATNPLDLTATAWKNEEAFEATAHALAGCAGVDLVAFVGDVGTHSTGLEGPGWEQMLAGVSRATRGRVPAALITSTTDNNPTLPSLCHRNGVTFLPGMRNALRAIHLVGERQAWLDTLPEAGEPGDQSLGWSEPASDAVRELLSSQPEVVSEGASKAVLELCGIPVPAGGTAGDAEEAVAIARRVGYPVVAKLDAVGLAHKTEIGGVILGIDDDEALRSAVETLSRRGADAVGVEAVIGVRVERAADLRDGVEMILGGRNDAAGSLVVVGAGGVLTELLADAVTIAWPFTPADVERAVRSLRVNRLLSGYRGSSPIAMDALVDAVCRVGRILAQNPGIREIDVNPLWCSPAGVIALDGLLRVSTDPDRFDSTRPAMTRPERVSP